MVKTLYSSISDIFTVLFFIAMLFRYNFSKNKPTKNNRDFIVIETLNNL